MHGALRHRLERIEPRYAANIPATLLCDGITAPATIKNISCYGALVECHLLPDVGAQLNLITERHDLLTTTIWVGPDRFGVLFSSPVDPAEFTNID